MVLRVERPSWRDSSSWAGPARLTETVPVQRYLSLLARSRTAVVASSPKAVQRQSVRESETVCQRQNFCATGVNQTVTFKESI